MSEHQHHRKDDQPETIRQWYERTTSKARMTLIWCCGISIVFGACFFAFAPLKLAQFMQTANGAVTIPIAGGIWIAAFVYIFLVPSREVGFRSQESIEETQRILSDAVEKRIKPALETWQRIGGRVEAELNAGLMGHIQDAIKELRDAAAKITNSAETSHGEIQKFSAEAKPAIEALKSLNERIDRNLGGDFVDNVKAALESVKHMSLPPPDPGGVMVVPKEPKVDKALSLISKKPAPKPVIPPPPLVQEAPVPAPMPVASVPVPPITQNPVAVPNVLSSVPTLAPVPMAPTPVVAPSSIPVMVPTAINQSPMPVPTQPVAQAPTLAPTPSSRFAPAPPPAPVLNTGGQGPMAGMPAPMVLPPSPQRQVPVGGGPVQIVLPPSSSQRQAPIPAPELSGPPRPRSERGPRPGEVELTLTQKSKPIVITPITPQQMGVTIQGGAVPMVSAPQVIERAQG